MIFLSASIPSPTRNKVFYDTADVIAIRDSVRALATVAIPRSTLIWGGHPAITPLIRFVLSVSKVNIMEHVTLFQSEFFRKQFPADNNVIEHKIITDDLGDRDSSLFLMREKMIKGYPYQAAFFIGGMEGVLEEYELFTKYHPSCPVFPVASTGAAARILYDKMEKKEVRLLQDYAYMELFSHLLRDVH